jgi:hypothetical protein
MAGMSSPLTGALRRALALLVLVHAPGGCSGNHQGESLPVAPQPVAPQPGALQPGEPTREPVDARCALPSAPVVLRQEGASVLQYWQLEDSEFWFQPILPDDPAYLAYRAAIREAGGDVMRPVADEPEPDDAQQREVVRRERLNAEVAYSGRAGSIRPIHCLEALLFAYQNNRYSQIEHPTEFLASIVRKDVAGRPMLRVFFSASDMMFPPKAFYGFDEIEKQMAEGWRHWVLLHNHTVQSNQGRVALGVPAPSTSDIHLFRNLSRDRGLDQAWVTNGFFTIEVPARDFGVFHARE